MLSKQVLSQKGKNAQRHLEEAEAILVSLARKVQARERMSESEKTHLKIIHRILTKDQHAERQQAEIKQKSLSRQILELENRNQLLQEEIDVKIDALTNQTFKNKDPLKQLDIWYQAAQTRFQNKQIDLEAESLNYTRNIETQTQLLEEQKNALQEQEVSLNLLIDENKKLEKPDRTKSLRDSLEAKQSQLNRLLAKVGPLIDDSRPTITSVKEKLKTLQREFDQIIEKSESLNTQLPQIKDHRKRPKRSKKPKDQEMTEMDHLIEEVKNVVVSKQKKIQTVKIIETDIENILMQKQEIQSEQKNELNRVEQQKARNRLISEAAKERDDLKVRLKETEEKLQNLHTSLKNAALQQQSILEEQESVNFQYETILELQAAVIKGKEELKHLFLNRVEETGAGDIWYDSIVRRIKKVRQEINLGPLLIVLLSPKRARTRYQSGLLIRKEVILAERSLCQLGFLDPSYLSRIDIFNRANSKNQQLSIDILNCST